MSKLHGGNVKIETTKLWGDREIRVRYQFQGWFRVGRVDAERQASHLIRNMLDGVSLESGQSIWRALSHLPDVTKADQKEAEWWLNMFWRAASHFGPVRHMYFTNGGGSGGLERHDRDEGSDGISKQS